VRDGEPPGTPAVTRINQLRQKISRSGGDRPERQVVTIGWGASDGAGVTIGWGSSGGRA